MTSRKRPLKGAWKTGRIQKGKKPSPIRNDWDAREEIRGLLGLPPLAYRAMDLWEKRHGQVNTQEDFDAALEEYLQETFQDTSKPG